MVNVEEMCNANDVYNENPIAEECKANRKTIGKD
jgi:hypothetical protein